MKPVTILAAILLAVTAPASLAASAAAAPPAPTGAVEMALDPNQISTILGDQFTIRSDVLNPGGQPTDRLIAHLTVASLTSSVYVDPEDWSSSRTRELAPLAANDRTSLSWDLKAVNAGDFDVYVVLLPNGAASTGTGPLIVSPPVHVVVAGRQTLTAGGALPIALLIPILLGLVAAATRYRLRRTG
jgi:hypothetical protein